MNEYLAIFALAPIGFLLSAAFCVIQAGTASSYDETMEWFGAVILFGILAMICFTVILILI